MRVVSTQSAIARAVDELRKSKLPMHEANTIRKRYEYKDGKFNVYQEQDVDPWLDHNQAAYNAAPETGRFNGDRFYRMAKIPNLVYVKFCKELGIPVNRWFDSDTLDVIIKRYLNSAEYRKLRTYPGRM